MSIRPRAPCTSMTPGSASTVPRRRAIDPGASARAGTTVPGRQAPASRLIHDLGSLGTFVVVELGEGIFARPRDVRRLVHALVEVPLRESRAVGAAAAPPREREQQRA